MSSMFNLVFEIQGEKFKTLSMNRTHPSFMKCGNGYERHRNSHPHSPGAMHSTRRRWCRNSFILYINLDKKNKTSLFIGRNLKTYFCSRLKQEEKFDDLDS